MKDFVKVVYSWFNANKIRNEKWLNNSKLTHNYLIWLTTEKAMELEKHSDQNITLEIDVMNNPSKGMDSLQDYINSKLIFEKETNNKGKVIYVDSKKSWSIQLADIFSNFIYRNLKNNNKMNLDEIPWIFERKVY